MNCAFFPILIHFLFIDNDNNFRRPNTLKYNVSENIVHTKIQLRVHTGCVYLNIFFSVSLHDKNFE